MTTLLFAGTGGTRSTPNLHHTDLKSPSPCTTCLDALNIDSKNRRNNTSLLVIHNGRNILFDMAKSFRDGYLRVLFPHGVRTIDAVLVSHGYADALIGVDDLRDFQKFEQIPHPERAGVFLLKCLNPFPVYLTPETLTRLRSVAPYITEPSLTGKTIVERRVTLLSLHQLQDVSGINRIQDVGGSGLEIVSFAVKGAIEALGYSFLGVVYIPYAVFIPEESYAFLRSQSVQILIIDCADFGKKDEGPHHHFNVQECVQVIHALKPRHVYLVGVSCVVDHQTLCVELETLRRKELSSYVETFTAAYDGMELTV
eukprot:PhF_6_TR3429/c0_g1_i1/m.4992